MDRAICTFEFVVNECFYAPKQTQLFQKCLRASKHQNIYIWSITCNFKCRCSGRG